MKNLLLVVGTVTLFAAPAGAENAKKSIGKKPVVVAQADKTTPVAAPAVAPALPAVSGEMLALPELPADASSPLNPFPELKAPVVVAKTTKAKPVVMNMGDKYMLGAKHDSAKPGAEVQQIVPKSLSQSQVATVIQSHMADVQTCWSSVPKQLRVDACTADLKLSISEAGDVTDIELGAEVPAGAQKCLTSAISHWKFPAAEAKSDVEYGISLRSL
jgi:hypothetical protein